jgi:iron complex outermembrane recepter protein
MNETSALQQRLAPDIKSLGRRMMKTLFHERALLIAGISIGALSASTALAQSTPAAGLDEIIVTAQKREQNLQDVPAAVSAFSADQLLARGVTQTSDLMGTLPNLQVTSAYSSTQPNFSLRGISVANEFSASTASPVGVYVDEVYQSFRASHGQQLYDLERVEVLRGPQGTLYGRNTTGGAINFITRKPDLDGANGYLTVGYGNYNTLTTQAGFEATLIPDKLGIRFAGTRAKGEGYTFNPVDKLDYGTTSSIAGRVSLRWKPSDGIDINLKGYIAENDPRQDLPYGIGYLTGRTNAAGYSRFVARPELGGRLLKQNEIQADTAGEYFTASRGLSLTIQAELSDAVTITSITGYDYGKYRLSPFDCDGSPVNICAIRYNSQSKNFNQDFRLNYTSDRLKLIGGLYYGVDTIDTQNQPDFFGFLRPLLLGAGVPGGFNNIPIAVGNSLKTIPAFLVNPALTPTSPGYCAPIVINPAGYYDARSLIAFQTDVATTNSAGGTASQAACAAAGAPPFGPILADQRFTLSRPSTAVYGEAAWKATEALTVTLGLRYTWDKVRYTDAITTLRDLSGNGIVAGLVPFSFPYNAALPPVNQRRSTGELTGRIVVDYKFTDKILGYASYSRGYRAGTFNGLAYQDISQVYFLDPEKVNAYEVGLKSRFLDNKVQLNLAGFYYDYKNQQIAQIIGATSFLRSAKGRVYGGEAELAVQIADPLRFDASFGYLNTKYSGNTINAADPRSLTLNINGNPFPNAPEVTFSAGFDFTAVDTGKHKLTLRGDTQYMGKYYFDPFKDYGQSPCDKPRTGTLVLQATPEIACGNPAYWLFNARATYTYDERFSVSVWGKNLTNKFYYVYGLNLNAFYQDYLTRGTPRTWGVEATARF